MNKAVELIRTSQVFFLATTEGNQPRVRPFGAVAEINGKVYIGTTNDKKCYAQMITNPQVEMAGMLPDGKWIRVCGTVKEDSDYESKVEFLNQNPALAGLYSADNESFVLFYFDGGALDIYGHTGIEENYDL